MTADFKIGNAEIRYEDSIGYYLGIDIIELPDAPHFLNDTLTSNTNYRSMSNTACSEFMREHKLDSFCALFHESCPVKVTNAMVIMFTEARKRHEAIIGEKVPGWCSLPDVIRTPEGVRFPTELEIDEAMALENVDPDLARLMWFEWWLKWSLKNCEYPAIIWS